MELEKERLYTEIEYESFDHNGLTEFDNGRIISMAPPTTMHQRIIGELFFRIRSFLSNKNCEVFVSPFNVRLTLNDGIRRVEPDISVICDKSKLTKKGCEGSPDFVIEVVSPSNKMHDYSTKVNWYEKAGIKEYWIVDPQKKQILTYCFDIDDVVLYNFSENIPVSIWNGELHIDFSELIFE